MSDRQRRLVWLVYPGSGEHASIDDVRGPLSRSVKSEPLVVALAGVGAVAWLLRRERVV